MNNEEKILDLLGKIIDEQAKIYKLLCGTEYYPQAAITSLQQDVAVLKSAVSYLTQEVNNLKKAQ